MRRPRRLVLITAASAAFALAAFALTGCATMNVSAHIERGVDFSQFRTWDFGPADALPTGDPRVHLRPVITDRMTMVPLTERAEGIQAYKLVVQPTSDAPSPRVHEGYEWLYVLSGRLRLVLPTQERHRDGSEPARGERQERQHGPRAGAGPGMIEGEARAQRAERASQGAERSSSPEVAAPQPIRDQLAHPRRPRVVARHGQDRASRRHREQDGALDGLRERQPGQERQREGKLSRDADGPQRRAAAAPRSGQPGGGNLHDLRGEGQRAEDAHQHRGETEIQRPRGDRAAAGARADQLGHHSFGNRDPQSAADRALSGRWQAKRPSHAHSGGAQGRCGVG